MPSVEYHAEMQGDLGFDQNSEAAQAGQPPSRSAQRVRVYPVRWDRIRAALVFLKENNPFYEEIDTQIPEGPDAGEFTNAPFQQIPQFVQTDNQPQLAESALAEALNHLTPDEVRQHFQLGADADADAAQQRGRRPHYHLERNGEQPLSIHDCKNIEAMSLLKLYPKGRNHFGTARDFKVQNNTNARTRMLSADSRCQEPHHMAY